MFAEIIPLRRTPFGLDVLDYKLPDHLDVHPGQFARITLRGQKTVGLVRSVKAESNFAARVQTIQGILPFALPTTCIDLLTWVGERTFSSLPTVAHAWFGELPKRLPLFETTKPALARALNAGSAEAHWRQDYVQALIARANEALLEGKRVLILTPWATRLPLFQAELPDANLLHGKLNEGDFFRHWSSFIVGANTCLIGTRLAAWLAPVADLVLIDEPENDDHKQDEQAPRYDARRLASWSAKYAGTKVEAYGLTPPIHSDTPAPTIDCPLLVHPYHPAGRSPIPCLQADSLLALREHEGARVIIHPIRGSAARLTCRDCGWQSTCIHCNSPLSADSTQSRCRQCGKTAELALSCGSCGSVDLGKATPGIEVLKKAWSKQESELVVQWRDTTSEALEAPFPANALVVVTLAQLLGGMSEDIRRTERRLVATRRLMNQVAKAGGTLLIQSTENELPLWEAWKTTEGVRATLEQERATRRLFNYPPSWRRVKCLFDGSAEEADSMYESLRKAFFGQGTVEKPLKINFRRVGSVERYAIHLLCSPEFPEATLVQMLQPFAKSLIIDLDPIAFFK